MNRRRQRPNWFLRILLLLLIAAGLYSVNSVIPNIASPFVPTPTATRPPESYVTDAKALFDQGKLLQSIQAYQQAISADPKNASYYVEMARVQVFAGQYADAQKNAEYALLLNNKNSMAHAVRAWALDFQGDYLGAEASIKDALNIDPQNAVAHAYYAEILIDEGPDTVQKAIDESNTAKALAPDTLETHRARGYVLQNTGNYQDAINEYDAAIAINPNIADLHLSEGINYRALGFYDKAIQQFTLANTLNPTDPEPNYYTSRTYATVGEYTKAVQYAEAAVNDKSADAKYISNLAVMYYYNNQWSEALKEFDLAVNGGVNSDGLKVDPVQLVPNSPRIAEIYYTYALLLAHTNNCGTALQIAQKILDRLRADQTSVDHANEAIKICQQNLNITPTPALPSANETAIPSVTPTP
jgi:tetratricopeptide (TPR) repeat protein